MNLSLSLWGRGEEELMSAAAEVGDLLLLKAASNYILAHARKFGLARY